MQLSDLTELLKTTSITGAQKALDMNGVLENRLSKSEAWAFACPEFFDISGRSIILRGAGNFAKESNL